MDLAQAQAWTVIIVATGGAIASVISAIRSGKIVSDTNTMKNEVAFVKENSIASKERQIAITAKVDDVHNETKIIHEQTNDRLTRLESELKEARDKLGVALTLLTRVEMTRAELVKEITAASDKVTITVEKPKEQNNLVIIP